MNTESESFLPASMNQFTHWVVGSVLISLIIIIIIIIIMGLKFVSTSKTSTGTSLRPGLPSIHYNWWQTRTKGKGEGGYTGQVGCFHVSIRF